MSSQALKEFSIQQECSGRGKSYNFTSEHMFKILSELYDKRTRHGFFKPVQKNDQTAQIYMEHGEEPQMETKLIIPIIRDGPERSTSCLHFIKCHGSSCKPLASLDAGNPRGCARGEPQLSAETLAGFLLL